MTGNEMIEPTLVRSRNLDVVLYSTFFGDRALRSAFTRRRF